MNDFAAMTTATSKTLYASLARFINRVVRIGVEGYDRNTRRRLLICNIAGYLSAISSLSFVVNFALYDAMLMKWLILGNLASAVLTGTAPYWHRYNALISPIIMTVTVAVTLFFFVSELGRDSGIHLNYIGAVAIAFAIFGLRYLPVVGTVVLICIAGHVASHFMFETGRLQPEIDPQFINQIYILSAVSIILVLALIVWYAYSLAERAENETELLLLNILPVPIAEKLRDEPDQTIADRFETATVLFADIVNFTTISRTMSANALVDMLNGIFSEFDQSANNLGVEKIKTIGDAYMAASGLPELDEKHSDKVVQLALELQRKIKLLSEKQGIDLNLRIGIATGPVAAGVIGKSRFAYDIWSNTVNLAARLQSHCEPGFITVCETTHAALKNYYSFEALPEVNLKGIGKTKCWRLVQGSTAA